MNQLRNALKIITKFITGILISIAIILVPGSLFLVLLGGSNAGFAVGFIAAPIMVFSGIVILVLQITITSKFMKCGQYSVIAGIWAIYLLIGIIQISLNQYKLNQRDKYTSRSFEERIPEIRSVLAVSNNNNSQYNYTFLGGRRECNEACVLFLRKNARNRLAYWSKAEWGFWVFALATGQDCEKLRLKKRNLSPRYQHRASEQLKEHGYLDQCISSTILRDFKGDITIEAGREFRQFMGVADRIANIYDTRNGGNKFLGRWEAAIWTRKKYSHHGKLFNLMDIVNSLTGKNIANKFPVK